MTNIYQKLNTPGTPGRGSNNFQYPVNVYDIGIDKFIKFRPYSIVKVGDVIVNGLSSNSNAQALNQNSANSSAAGAATGAPPSSGLINSVQQGIQQSLQSVATLRPTGIGCITLPIPPNIQDSNLYQFSKSDLGRAYGLIANGLLSASSGGLGSMKGKVTHEMAGAMAQNAAIWLGNGPLQSDGAGLAATLFGAPNPFMKVNFTASAFKQHQFNFVLIARNAQDSQLISQIISIFRYFSAPQGRDSSIFDTKYGWLLNYSSEVEKFTYKFNPCYLTSIVVTYNPLSQVSSWHGDGSPNDVLLQLSFTEMVVISQETYDEQYSSGNTIPQGGSANAFLNSNGIGVGA